MERSQLDEGRRSLAAATTERAASEFTAYDFAHANRQPGNAIDELQDQLYVYAIPCDVQRSALAIIEQLGVTFGTDDAERAVEGLGTLLALSAVLATLERLAITPIIELAEIYRSRLDVQPIKASGALAAAVMLVPVLGYERTPIPAEKERRIAIVDALALAIAKAIDDVEISHDLAIKPIELLYVVGRELLAGKRAQLVPISTPPVADVSVTVRSASGTIEHHALAATASDAHDQLQAAAGALVDLEVTEPGDFAVDSGTTAKRRPVGPGAGGDPAEPPSDHDIDLEVDIGDAESAEVLRGVASAPPRDAGALIESALHTIAQRELADAEARADANDELMASTAAGGPFWGVGKAPTAEVVGLEPSIPNTTPKTWDEFATKYGVTPGGGGSGPTGSSAGGGGAGAGPMMREMGTVRIPPRHAGTHEFASQYQQHPMPLSDAVPGLANDRICPQCAAPMSLSGVSDLWVCTNGHAHDSKDLARVGRQAHTQAAPAANALPPRMQIDRPDPIARSSRNFPPAPPAPKTPSKRKR